MTDVRQEPDLLPGKKVTTVLVGLIVIVVIGYVAAFLLGDCRARELGAPPDRRVTEAERIPAEVNAMETTIFDEEAQGLEDQEVATERLDSYGWVDRERGLVHIPIEQAFDVYLERREEER